MSGLICRLSAWSGPSSPSGLLPVLCLALIVSICQLMSVARAAESPFDVRNPVADVDTVPTDAILNPLEITRKVIGGAESVPGQWPSVVGLVRTGTRPLKQRFFCGGTVVAERWVMTAAHCLFNAVGGEESPSSMRVVAGIHDLVADSSVEEVVVTNIIIHPQYDNDSDLPPNDIALLELATEIDAPAGTLFAGDYGDYTGTPGIIVGWGATQYLSEEAAFYPDSQQQAEVPLVSLEVCNSPESYQGMISIRQLCAGFEEGGVDTCAGDSGGPLYVIENEVAVQVGITSFGSGCGRRNLYGIYTSVSHYLQWLSNYLSVPEQSTALIAEWDSQPLYPSQSYDFVDSGDGGSNIFGGSVSPWMSLLMVLLAIRGICKTCTWCLWRRRWNART